MGTRLYVGNIPYGTTDLDLRTLFGQNGRRVTEVRIITDRETGQSRGFAFVQMATDEEAQAVVAELNGSSVGGRSIVVNEARERTGGPGGGGGGPRPPGPRGAGPPRSGGFAGGAGGYRAASQGGGPPFPGGGPGGPGQGPGKGGRNAPLFEKDGGRRRRGDRDREREREKYRDDDDDY